MRDNWRGWTRTPGLGYKRCQLTQGASQIGPQTPESHVSKPSHLSNWVTWNHEAIPFVTVGWFMAQDSLFLWHHGLAPVTNSCLCAVLLWLFGDVGDGKTGVWVWKGKFPTRNYSERWGPRYTAPWRALVWRRVWSHIPEPAPWERLDTVQLSQPFKPLPTQK